VITEKIAATNIRTQRIRKKATSGDTIGAIAPLKFCIYSPKLTSTPPNWGRAKNVIITNAPKIVNIIFSIFNFY